MLTQLIRRLLITCLLVEKIFASLFKMLVKEERSDSMVAYLTSNGGVGGSSLIDGTALCP